MIGGSHFLIQIATTEAGDPPEISRIQLFGMAIIELMVTQSHYSGDK